MQDCLFACTLESLFDERHASSVHAGNLLGALGLVGLAVVANIFTAAPAGAQNVATYKTSHSFAEVCAMLDGAE